MPFTVSTVLDALFGSLRGLDIYGRIYCHQLWRVSLDRLRLVTAGAVILTYDLKGNACAARSLPQEPTRTGWYRSHRARATDSWQVTPSLGHEASSSLRGSGLPAAEVAPHETDFGQVEWGRHCVGDLHRRPTSADCSRSRHRHHRNPTGSASPRHVRGRSLAAVQLAASWRPSTDGTGNDPGAILKIDAPSRRNECSAVRNGNVTPSRWVGAEHVPRRGAYIRMDRTDDGNPNGILTARCSSRGGVGLATLSRRTCAGRFASRPLRTNLHASCNTAGMATTIDHDFLRAKYREERDKRLRPDGNAQYLEPTGKFAHFGDDPYVTPIERAPIFDEHTVVLIGGGFSGLCTGARLKQAGIDDVCIIESGGDVGGAWYWNRYPGAMCDTAAMVYLPLLEETGHMPTQKYVMAPEIFGHAQRIAKTFGLYDHAIFSTQVTRLEWDADASQWVIHTDRGDRIRARFVAMGTGPLNRPKLPGVAGHRDVRRPHVPHEPVGLRLHRWRLDRCADDGARRQARRHHRDRRDGGAVHRAARTRRRRAVRLPAHTVVDRRARQPPDRPRVVLVARARLAGQVAHELRDAARLRVHGRGPGPGRMDRPRAARPAARARDRGREPRHRAHARAHPARLRRERRREDGGHPRALRRGSCRIPPPPRR